MKNQIEQLKKLGYSQTDAEKAVAIMSNPKAHEHLLKTGDPAAAYALIEQETKEESHTLTSFFSEFCKVEPESAKGLSIALSKFSRYVQSQCDRNRAS